MECSNISTVLTFRDFKEPDGIAAFRPVDVEAGTAPNKRSGSTCVVAGQYLYVFGGSDYSGSFYGDTHRFCFVTKTWSCVAANGSGPRGRHLHSAVLRRNSIVVFGGKCGSYLNDMHEFNIATGIWREYKTPPGCPSKRFGHSAVYQPETDTMYICGGYDSFGESCNDLYAFSFKNLSWMKIHPASGTVPPLLQHSAVLWQGSIYVLGGYKQKPFSLYEFRLGSRSWGIVRTSGKAPNMRWGHKAVAAGGFMYVFGGGDSAICYGDLHIYDFANCRWERRIAEGLNPRYFHDLCLLETPRQSAALVVFGGRNTHQFLFNDLHVYPLDEELYDAPDSLLQDMRGLLDSPEFSDVIIEFPKENSKRIYCHKSILCTRSEHFRAMLCRSGMKESQAGVISITNVAYDVFYRFLEYLYTSQVGPDVTFEICCELLKLSEQYLLPHLKLVCGRILQRSITEDNVQKLLKFASTLQAAELQAACRKLCAEYRLSETAPESSEEESSTSESSH